MERWLKASAAVEAVAEPVDEQKATDRVTAVKAEIAKAWDATATRDDMLAHVENWLVGAKTKNPDGTLHDHGAAPPEVRGCMLREELHALMEAVYREKHPEDFEKAEEPVGGAGPYRTPGEAEEIGP